MKRLLEKRWVRIYLLVIIVGLLLAFVAVPMVRGWGLPNWSGQPLTDSTGLLNDENHLAINAVAEKMADQSSTDVRVAVVDSLNGEALEAYTQRLYDHWGMGRKTLNGGLLLVISADTGEAYGLPGGGFGKFMPEGTLQNFEDGNVHSAVMRLLETTGKQLQAFRFTDLALKPNKDLSIWEKLTPLWVVLGIAVIMAPIVLQEREYFFGRKENRGGLFRPMYNVGGGNLGQPNYHARGKN